MLKSIYIKNYILIDETELEYSDGLNIITGETGAGKSILIGAIDAVFGARLGKNVIKTGADKAVIELTLINKKHDVNELFDEYGIDNNGEEIVLSREITQTGSRSRVNGCLVNQEFLKIMREIFLDIHSQHQTYSFLQKKNHIKLLDSYIKNPLNDNYKKSYDEYRSMLSELEILKNAAQRTEEQTDFLKFQVEEIENAEIVSPDEDEKLEAELAVLENAEKLKDLTGSSFWALSGDDGSILDALFEIKSSLTKASNLDPALSCSETDISEIIESVKALSSSLREYSSGMENDTQRIDEIQGRIFILDKLKRKYGGTLEKVLETGLSLRKELDNIEFSTQNIEKLELQISQKESELIELAELISSERKRQGNILSKLIVEKLEKLELAGVKFSIDINKTELGAAGFDEVEFLISTNVSEGLKPLAEVASGGEISRVMLAVKSIFALADSVDTVVFDEIDTGISGKTSQSVADEVKELARYMQIIMITHQAIIASKSDRHIYVRKTQGDRTKISISVLDDGEKLKAIAELASGEISDESLNLAKTLIN